MRDRQSALFPPFTTIWPKGQMGYFRNAPSENQWANRGVQFLFVVIVGSSLSLPLWVLSISLLRQGGGRQYQNIGSERGIDTERQRQRDGEKKGGCWVGGQLRDRVGVKASRDTSQCQTHRHTAATDSSLQPRLQAQLDTGRG